MLRIDDVKYLLTCADTVEGEVPVEGSGRHAPIGSGWTNNPAHSCRQAHIGRTAFFGVHIYDEQCAHLLREQSAAHFENTAVGAVCCTRYVSDIHVLVVELNLTVSEHALNEKVPGRGPVVDSAVLVLALGL
jgi:hypothetical protein